MYSWGSKDPPGGSRSSPVLMRPLRDKKWMIGMRRSAQRIRISPLTIRWCTHFSTVKNSWEIIIIKSCYTLHFTITYQGALIFLSSHQRCPTSSNWKDTYILKVSCITNISLPCSSYSRVLPPGSVEPSTSVVPLWTLEILVFHHVPSYPVWRTWLFPAHQAGRRAGSTG